MEFKIDKSTLEFIQITCLVEFIPNSSLLAFLLGKVDSTAVENFRQIHSIMQNEPNFLHFSTKNKDMTKKRTQFKPNFNSIIRGGKAKRTQEFIRIPCSLRGRAKSQRPRRQVKKARRHSLIMGMLLINNLCFFVGTMLYGHTNNYTHETYHPKGCYVENVF